MLLFKKKTFKELIASDEGVATNLLSSRLKMLESLLLITKRKLPRNKKENIYLLTDRGIDMAPIVMELAIWSDKHARSFNPEMNAIENGYKDKAQVIDSVQRTYREFANSVIESGVTS